MAALGYGDYGSLSGYGGGVPSLSKMGFGGGGSVPDFSNYGVPSFSGAMANPAGASNPVAAYMSGGNVASAPVAGAAPGGPPAVDPGSGFGFNIDTGRLALGGLQTIGSLWGAWQANKLAKQQFNFAKQFAQANFANQVQTYNTSLEDRIKARTFTEGGSSADAQSYIDAHQLHNRLG